MGKITKTLTILLAIYFSCLGNMYAGETGQIAGKIVDKETGEPLIGANVIVLSKLIEGKEVKLDFPFGAATDFDGEYFILNLPPGSYNVKVSYVGYSEEIRTKVEVNIEKTTKLDFQLSPKTISAEEVLVVGFRKNEVDSDLTATRQTYV